MSPTIAALLLVGCSSSRASSPDAGVTLVDAAVTSVDASVTEVDAGGTPVDASGTLVDAGGTPVDAGGTLVDAGVTFVSSTAVTPTGNFQNGDFVRIFNRRDASGIKVLVTFSTKLNAALAPGTCPDPDIGAYVYREFNMDMTPTGKEGVIACKVLGDNGALLVGNDDFYLAVSGVDPVVYNRLDGWQLAKYHTTSWTTLPAPPAAPLVGPFPHVLPCGMVAGDPMLAYVNGQIDIDGKFYGPDCCGDQASQPAYCQPSPTKSETTHHTFFDTNLKFLSGPMVLPVPPNPGHIDLDSMIVVDGVTNLLAGSAILGDLVVMRFDQAWKPLPGPRLPLKPHAWCPEGVVYYGSHFYVSYIDTTGCTDLGSCVQNVRLAVFDAAWSVPPALDIPITSFTSVAGGPQKPTMTLIDNLLYVAYISGPTITTSQVYVAVFRLD